jgi:hypothetical protein
MVDRAVGTVGPLLAVTAWGDDGLGNPGPRSDSADQSSGFVAKLNRPKAQRLCGEEQFPGALSYVRQHQPRLDFNGELCAPVMTLHAS